MTEWQSAEDRNNREKTNRARQAAEDLFKPAPHEAEAGAPASPPDDAASAEQPGRRQPRIFTIPPRVPAGAEAEAPAVPKPIRQRPAARRPAGTVPPSQIGRVRTLASYGMTTAQVAELYEVSVAEIERIIGTRAHSGKSR